MDSASPDLAVQAHDADRETRIARGTDARCLENMLQWGRRTFLMVPTGVLLTWMAWQLGARWWALAWFVVWAGLQIHFYRTAGWLQAANGTNPKVGIARMTGVFWAAGCLHALLLPLFFVDTGVATKLTVTLLLAFVGGAVVMSCSGIPRAYIGVVVLPTMVVAAGWFWHGGVLGYGLALLYAGSALVGFVGVQQQRQSWEELVRLLDDNEVLAASLKAERDRAQAASESKTRFFAAASHDLRQPLHALSINATTLDLVARRSGNALLQNLSHGIDSALRQSRSLLDGLLDISRLDAHVVHLHIAPHDIRVLLETVREEFAALAAQRGLSIDVDTGSSAAWVLTDADQLLRILGNLVDNAIKFTREGGVRLSAAPAPPGRLRVCVSDTGPGIPEAERERVFEEFYQVGNPSRDRAQGLGLGLAIVKRTAELLEVPLQLVSDSGRGVSVELSLAAAPPGTALRLPESEPLSPSALSVLLVDDEPDVLASLCTYLHQIGWTARGVASGDEADQVLAAGHHVDVLVVDFRLRGESGQDVIARLREHQKDLPAVIVTGDTAAYRLCEQSVLPATVLHKPIDGTRLARALVEAVRSAPGNARQHF
jgi:signal transduction histidine kinase/CheY-like chemotaxis protein